MIGVLGHNVHCDGLVDWEPRGLTCCSALAMPVTFSPTFDRFLVDPERDLGKLPEILLRYASRVLRRRASAAPKHSPSTWFCSPAFGVRVCACASPEDGTEVNVSANG